VEVLCVIDPTAHGSTKLHEIVSFLSNRILVNVQIITENA
jgi:hypothetical protein